MRHLNNCFLYAIFSLFSLSTHAVQNTSSMPVMENMVVYGYRQDLLGNSISAAEGVIGSAEIDNRPVSRIGEILEFVPGMVVTQHSGGNTEVSRASERSGIELAAYVWFVDGWSLDTELAWTRSRFTDNQIDEGKYVDGSLKICIFTR